VRLPPTILRFKLDIVLNSGKGSTRQRSGDFAITCR
jgi:hypothetical protein